MAKENGSASVPRQSQHNALTDDGALRKLGHLQALVQALGQMYEAEVGRGGPKDGLDLGDLFDLAEALADEVYQDGSRRIYNAAVAEREGASHGAH
jgi:hypothetical protein